MKLRIKFIKKGPLRFIGHLDVMRYFQKAIRRAGIDVAYTSGFSPHQIMSFAAPLGVGLESNGEYMDIVVNSMPEGEDGETPCERIVSMLDAAGVKELKAVSARLLEDNAKNVMSAVAAASYTVRFREGAQPEMTRAELDAAVERFLAMKEIPVVKETKSGTRQIDLRAGIYEFYQKEDDGAFYMLVDASSAGNIKPVKVMETFLEQNGLKLQKNALFITREDIYTRSADDETTFVSLGQEGKP